MSTVKLSSKNQIVVPREAREALGLRAGSRLLVVVRGDTVVLRRKPTSYTEAIEGLAGRSYPSSYLDQERESWK